MKMWDPETVNAFLVAAADSRYRDLYHVAVLTGLRRSELAGLRWENVNLAAGRLSVVETLQRLTGKGLTQGQPKTPRSRRSIALCPEAVAVMHDIRGGQMAPKLAVEGAWHETGYVFTQANGSPIDPEKVSHDFAAVVRQAGLPHLTFHGLRHAYASLASAAGVKPKEISDQLGHSSIAVTMDIYSHLLPGMQEQAALAVQELLARARDKGGV